MAWKDIKEEYSDNKRERMPLRKQFLWIGVFFLSCIIVVSVVWAIFSIPAVRIRHYCGVKLPKAAEVEYKYFASGGLGGLQDQYFVFQLKSEPDEFLDKYEFSAVNPATDSQSESEGNAPSSEFERRFSSANIPQEYLPDWENSYLGKTFNFVKNSPSTVTILYFPDTMRLICIVWGH